MRIPRKPSTHNDLKPSTCSSRKPSTDNNACRHAHPNGLGSVFFYRIWGSPWRAKPQGPRSYASCIDFFAEAQLARLNKTTSCEAEVATGQSERDVIRVAAGALAREVGSQLAEDLDHAVQAQPIDMRQITAGSVGQLLAKVELRTRLTARTRGLAEVHTGR